MGLETVDYISIAFSAFSLLCGAFSWALNLKIKHDILVNNAKIEKDMDGLKEKLGKDMEGVNTNLVRELSTFKDKFTARLEDNEHDTTELKSNLNDRILATVNGKYVRSELHEQSCDSTQKQITTLQYFIEKTMSDLRQNLDRQIVDLKERILGDGK